MFISFLIAVTVIALVMPFAVIGPSTIRDWMELRQALDYRTQAVYNGIERDNLQLQLDQLRSNLRKRDKNGVCVCNPPVGHSTILCPK